MAHFLDSVALGIERFHVEIHAYCLMANHFHLMVGTPLGNISQFMQSVQTRYGGYFNIRHSRSGYVFQGPYGAKLVEGDEYLLTMSRYIHLNPVRLGSNKDRPLKAVLDDLNAYRWSSFLEYTGRAKRKEWMTYAAVESHVSEVMGKRRGAYGDYVERDLVESDKDLEEMLQSKSGMIATRAFVQDVLESMGGREDAESAAFRSVWMPVSVRQVMDTVFDELGIKPSYLSSRRGSAWARGVAAEMLCTYAGLTHVAAARELGMGTGASISIRRKALAQDRAKDRRLDRRVHRIAKRLDRLLRER